MPYSIENPPDAIKELPDHARRIWITAFNASLDGTCKNSDDKEACAHKIAWASVERAGYQRFEDGAWKKQSEAMATMTMTITKASYGHDNVMRWKAVASDTEKDLYGESMSAQLFKSFVKHIEDKDEIPEAFRSAICEDAWCGGKPYISLSHYKAGSKAKNVPGLVEETYIDGNRLKSEGILYDNQLGRAVFRSLNEDLFQKKSDPNHQPVRVSIGFLDLQHRHTAMPAGQDDYVFTRSALGQICPLCASGIGDKIYEDGFLVHEALTRVPVNPRTEMEVKSMGNIITRKDDAESIIGKDLAAELEEKSLAPDVLVVKADGTNEPMDIPDGMDGCYDSSLGVYNQDCVDALMMGHKTVNVAGRKDMNLKQFKHEGVQGGQPKVTPDRVQGKSITTKALTKKEGWGEEHAGSYLIVGDPQKVTTWHLPVKKGGKINTGLMGAAKAALTSAGGHRGHKYGGPDKEKAIAKLRTLYQDQGLKFDDGETKKKSYGVMSKELMEEANMASKIGDVKNTVGDKWVNREETNENELTESPLVDENVESEDGKFVEWQDALADEKQSGRDAYPRNSKGKDGEDDGDADDEKVSKSFKDMMKKKKELAEKGIVGDAALKALQPYFNQMGDAVQKSVMPRDLAQIASVVKSAVAEGLAEYDKKVQTQFAMLKAQTGNVAKSGGRPVSKAVTVTPEELAALTSKSNTGAGGRQLSQIERIARKSTGAK